MARRSYFRDYWYTPATPKEVEGGIKAQSKRGAFTQKWWGRRWIETLESFNLGARLSRGSSYARKGQVVSLDIGPGKVTARVQGSRSTPYKVILLFKTFTDKQWNTVIEKLLEEPIYTARLLGNEMPEDIEGVFQSAGLDLFPGRYKDLETECSCPDWSNPCKHIAAVYYLLAESFDNDPFLLFTIRGMNRETFLKKLRESGGELVAESAGPEYDPVPLTSEPDVFWGAGLATEASIPVTATPILHASIPKRLNNVPFWRSETPFQEVMNSMYRAASQFALDAILKEEEKMDA